MDGLFFACLMGICGVSTPAAPAQAVVVAMASGDSVLLPSLPMADEVETRPQAILAPSVSSQDEPRVAKADVRSGAATAIGAAAKVGAREGAGGGKAAKADIGEVVKRKSKAIRRCYELGLLEDPHFGGTIEMQWRIDQRGRVSSANVVSTSRKNAAVETCLLAEIIRWEFPPTPEPIVIGSYPFAFDPTLLTH